MRKIITTTFGSLALIWGTPASAQTSDGTNQIATGSTADPARLKAAEATVDYLFPLGTYERMMKGTMDQIMDSVLAGMSGMTVGQVAGASGLPSQDMADEQKNQSIGDATRQADPHFDERMKISTKVMMDEMIDLMSAMEPQIRDALAKIYARKFTVPQLAEMNRFFATETGSIFARDYMMVFVDPEMMDTMMGFIPEMMQVMPAIVGKVEEATKHLPPPPKRPHEHGSDGEDAVEESCDRDVGCDAAGNGAEDISAAPLQGEHFVQSGQMFLF